MKNKKTLDIILAIVAIVAIVLCFVFAGQRGKSDADVEKIKNEAVEAAVKEAEEKAAAAQEEAVAAAVKEAEEKAAAAQEEAVAAAVKEAEEKAAAAETAVADK